MTFGQMLALYRNEAGMSQNELAKRSGVNVGSVSRIEHDQRDPTTARQVFALVNALGCTPWQKDRFLVKAGFSPCAVSMQAGDRWRRWSKA